MAGKSSVPAKGSAGMPVAAQRHREASHVCAARHVRIQWLVIRIVNAGHMMDFTEMSPLVEPLHVSLLANAQRSVDVHLQEASAHSARLLPGFPEWRDRSHQHNDAVARQ